MSYLTRQIILQLTKISEALQYQRAAIDAIAKNTKDQKQVQEETLKKALAAHDVAEGNKSNSDNRSYSVQDSIRWATWFAFGAAFFYGIISFIQWNDAHTNFKMAQRPWVGPQNTAQIVIDGIGKPNEKGTPVDYHGTARIQNFGISPAFKVGMWVNAWELHAGKDPRQEHEIAKALVCQMADQVATVQGASMFPQQVVVSNEKGPGSLVEFNSTYKVVLFEGCVAYADQFDPLHITHHTTFCVNVPIANDSQPISCDMGELGN